MARAGHDALVDELRAVVGERHVLVDEEVTAGYEVDWTRRWSGRSRCVVRPGDTAEVAAVVRACREYGAALVPQGGNSGLVGGGVPRGGEVVVSITRLDDLEPVDALAGQVTAGAGVTIAALHAHAEAAGFVYGVDLAARDLATVGGTLATNAGGVRVVRYGPTRAQVVGVEAVLGDGSVVRRLGGLVKDNVGYDLANVLVGSEGTLGVVTRARLRLHPRLAHRLVTVLGVRSVADALRVFQRLRGELDGIEAVELMHADGVDLVVQRTDASPPFTTSVPVYLLVEVAGRRDPTEEVAAVLSAADEVLDAAVAVDGPGRARLWRLREGHTEAIATVGVAHKLDLSVPLPSLPTLAARVPEVVEEVAPGSWPIMFGHAADGNLHVNVLGPAPADLAVDVALMRLVAELGGSISAEHGIGVHKVGHVELGRTAAELDAMRRIKAVLDPDGLCNPGALLPGT